MDPHDRLTGAARIRRNLLAWYERNRRDLPWRRTEDPYRIWISEIMLQQTRVQAVIPYYERFLARFPDVQALAAAPEAEVLACWSGLGYYSRARNLQRAARQIAAAGEFPRAYDSILGLAGVGEYTAAAVASIAFGLPHAVLDGNVKRVLARLRNESGEITSARTVERLRRAAVQLLDPAHPGRFNQAMMELGATLCVPRAPACTECPVAAFCQARGAGTAAQLPVKLRRREPVRIASTLLLVERNHQVLLWQRPEDSGRMAGFWELPEAAQLPGARMEEDLGEFQHSITHHRYTFRLHRAKAGRIPPGFRWIEPASFVALPLSTIARKAWKLALSGYPSQK
jgi:A/G-specific adenine glycosylase